MIKSKQELKFYIMADRMMNTGTFKMPFSYFIKDLITPNYILKYLESMRNVSYYKDLSRLQ